MHRLAFRSLIASFGLISTFTLFAQAPRTKLIAPPELWIRSDVDHDWGEARVMTTCSAPIEVHEQREERTNGATGAVDVVRTFIATCPCSNARVVEQQIVHLLPDVPLPQAVAASGCAPGFEGAPASLERTVGERGAWEWDGANTCVEHWSEQEFPLWFDACGHGESWLVWEATGACGDVARHALIARTLPAPAPQGQILLAASVDEAFFLASDFSVGPLTADDVQGASLPPIPTYRTWNSSSGGFHFVAVGCGMASTIGQQTVEITGNNAPRFRARPVVELACGTPYEDWPVVTCKDRPLAGFGPPPDLVDVPFEETHDTLPGDCPGNFSVIRNFLAVDDEGAEASATQTLIFHDQTPPAFFNSPDELVWHGDDWPPGAPTAQAEDACSSDIALVWSDSLDCATGGLFRITTASDGCGNLATLRQHILPKNANPALVLAVGCPDPNALNYTADACYQEVHCLYAGDSNCMGDLDGNGTVSTGDLLALLGIFGTLCPVE